jgi:hypothetical protein
MVALFRLEFFCAKPIMKKQEGKGEKNGPSPIQSLQEELSSYRGGSYMIVFS